MTRPMNFAIVLFDILPIIGSQTDGTNFFTFRVVDYRMIVGTEWLIEATGCMPERLRDEQLLRDVFDRIIEDLGLKSIGAVWHTFPGEGGVTGLVALTESHLACHTYPEHGTATFNLYCCRSRPEWNWTVNLSDSLRAETVSVTKIERGDANPESQTANPKSKMVGGDA